jgi:hypothetical protein
MTPLRRLPPVEMNRVAVLAAWERFRGVYYEGKGDNRLREEGYFRSCWRPSDAKARCLSHHCEGRFRERWFWRFTLGARKSRWRGR